MIDDAPLSGLLVADFSRVLAGPLATMWLADMGATVVKVERPGCGDDTRGWGPPWAAGTSTYFAAANRSKRSIALDLANDDDRDTARRLAHRADVVVENFRTGALDRHGLDYASVSAANAGVVYASITGFGSGAGRDLLGYDFVVQAMGGLMSITGDATGEPTKVGVAVVDVLTAKDATMGILAALRVRDRSGRGQHIEVNLLSSLLGSLANQAGGYLGTGTAPGRMGNRHPSIAPYETLRCKSGTLAVACGNDGQFRRMTAVLGVPEAADDARFASNAARVGNREALVALLESRLAAEDAEDWEQRFVAAEVPAGLVGDIGSALRRATELGLEPMTTLPAPHPPQVAHPIRFSASPVREPTPPPALGADTDRIRRWIESDQPLQALTTETETVP